MAPFGVVLACCALCSAEGGRACVHVLVEKELHDGNLHGLMLRFLQHDDKVKTTGIS